jgi:hypothetical protein
VTLLEESGLVTQAAPRSPITTIQGVGGEIFDIGAQIKPLPLPERVVVATEKAPPPPVALPTPLPIPVVPLPELVSEPEFVPDIAPAQPVIEPVPLPMPSAAPAPAPRTATSAAARRAARAQAASAAAPAPSEEMPAPLEEPVAEMMDYGEGMEEEHAPHEAVEESE